MSTLPKMRRYKLSEDGVAGIDIVGEGPKGAKSFNLITKAEMLEQLGLLFPRRNLVLKQSILLEGLRYAGLKDEWDNEPIPTGSSMSAARKKFVGWCVEFLWPLVEEIFEGRAFYIRSNAPGDSLGRGVYSSLPFVNNLYTGRFDDTLHNSLSRRQQGFAAQLLSVVESYFSETAAAFRDLVGASGYGINVLLCQFIGRPVDAFVSSIGMYDPSLLPFMSAVVKSTLVHGKKGGMVRFEYGLGQGAIKGRTLLFQPGEDGRPLIETIAGNRRIEGIDVSTQDMHAIMVSNTIGMVLFDGSNSAYFSDMLRRAYPCVRGPVEQEGEMLLRELIEKTPEIENRNGRPIYLELVVSSFRNKLRWFVVQVSDFDPMRQLPKPPEKNVFISSDFYGHGMLEESRRKIFILGKEFIKDPGWKLRLAEINRANKGFIVLIPQKALTGADLTQLSGGHFSNAGLVIEYRTLGSYKFERSVHIEDPSSEHFEQVMRDFDVLFIAAQNVLSDEDAKRTNPAGISEGTALVSAACDRERGFAWWKIDGLELVSG